MTEKFEKMLEYQNLDISLRKMTREFNQHPDKKLLDMTRNKFNDVQSRLDAESAESESLAAEIEKVYAEFQATMKAFEAAEKEFAAAQTDEEKAKFLPQLESLKSRLDSCKNKISTRIDRIKKISAESMSALQTKKKVKEEFDKIKQRLEEYRKSVMPAREKIEKQMKELEPSLDKELLKLYTQVKSEGVSLPVFIKAVGESENDLACGCGMLLSQTNKGELKSRKMCRCETCRRMVYAE